MLQCQVDFVNIFVDGIVILVQASCLGRIPHQLSLDGQVHVRIMVVLDWVYLEIPLMVGFLML